MYRRKHVIQRWLPSCGRCFHLTFDTYVFLLLVDLFWLLVSVIGHFHIGAIHLYWQLYTVYIWYLASLVSGRFALPFGTI